MSYRKRSTRDITRATEAASDAAARGASVDIERPPPRSMLIGSSLSRHGALSTTNIATSTEWKGSCRVATTTNITLENEQTIDDVAVVDGDRVLVKDQTDATTNGIWVCKDAAAWVRSEDCDDDAEALNFSCFVREGMTNANNQFVCTNDTVTLGTTELVIILYGAGGALGLGDISDVTLTDPIAVTEGTRKYIKYDASVDPPQWVDEDFPFTDEQITTFTTLTGVLSAATVDDATTLTISSALTVTGTSLLEGAMIIGTAATGVSGTSVLTVRGSGHVLGSFVVGQKLSTASSMEVARELKIGTRLPTTADHYIANAPGVFFLDGENNVRVFSGSGTESLRNLSSVGKIASPVTTAIVFNEATTMAKKLTISGGGFDVTGSSQFHDAVNIGSGGRIGQVLRNLHVNGKIFVGHATYNVAPTETAITAQGGIVCSSINSSGLLHCGSLSVDTTGTVTGISMENLGVVVTNPRSGNEILKYDGTNWNAVRNQLSALGDVDAGGTLSASNNGYVLTYVHAADADAKWQAKQIILPNNVDLVVGRASPATGNKNLTVYGSATIGTALYDVTPITTSFAVAHGNATFAKNVTVTETMKTKNLTVNTAGTVSGISIDDLGIGVTNPRSGNEILRYNGTSWSAVRNQLNALGDVSVSALSTSNNGYVLTYVHAADADAKWQAKQITIPNSINVTIGASGVPVSGGKTLTVYGNAVIDATAQQAVDVNHFALKVTGRLSVSNGLVLTAGTVSGTTQSTPGAMWIDDSNVMIHTGTGAGVAKVVNLTNILSLESSQLTSLTNFLAIMAIDSTDDVLTGGVLDFRTNVDMLYALGVGAAVTVGGGVHLLDGDPVPRLKSANGTFWRSGTNVMVRSGGANHNLTNVGVPSVITKNITIGTSGVPVSGGKTLTVYGNMIIDSTAQRGADSAFVAFKVSNGNAEFVNDVKITGNLTGVDLNDLSDVTIASGNSPGTGGDILVRLGANNWTRTKHLLRNIGDVSATNPSAGQILVFKSGQWTKSTLDTSVPSRITKNITIGTNALNGPRNLTVHGQTILTAEIYTDANSDFVMLDVKDGKAKFAGNVEIGGNLTVAGDTPGASLPTVISGNRTFSGAIIFSSAVTFSSTTAGLSTSHLSDLSLGTFPTGPHPAGGYLMQASSAGNLTYLANDISSIGNVNITSVSDNQILQYNSTSNKWENTDPAGASLPTVISGNRTFSGAIIFSSAVTFSSTTAGLGVADLSDLSLGSLPTGPVPSGGYYVRCSTLGTFTYTTAGPASATFTGGTVANQTDFSSGVTIGGTLTVNGNVTLGNATADSVTFLAGNIIGLDVADLSDANISSPSNGQVLIRANNKWTNGSPTVSTTIANLTLITDVPNNPGANQILKRNSTDSAYEWVDIPAGATIPTVAQLSDTVFSNLRNGHALIYNSTGNGSWRNGAISATVPATIIGNKLFQGTVSIDGNVNIGTATNNRHSLTVWDDITCYQQVNAVGLSAGTGATFVGTGSKTTNGTVWYASNEIMARVNGETVQLSNQSAGGGGGGGGQVNVGRGVTSGSRAGTSTAFQLPIAPVWQDAATSRTTFLKPEYLDVTFGPYNGCIGLVVNSAETLSALTDADITLVWKINGRWYYRVPDGYNVTSYIDNKGSYWFEQTYPITSAPVATGTNDSPTTASLGNTVGNWVLWQETDRDDESRLVWRNSSTEQAYIEADDTLGTGENVSEQAPRTYPDALDTINATSTNLESRRDSLDLFAGIDDGFCIAELGTARFSLTRLWVKVARLWVTFTATKRR